jgi:hypothetical protein
MNLIPLRPRKPDPRNGFVCATESYETKCVDDIETETIAGFIAVHMSHSGDSGAIYRGYATIQQAEAAARRIARDLNAKVAL